MSISVTYGPTEDVKLNSIKWGIDRRGFGQQDSCRYIPKCFVSIMVHLSFVSQCFLNKLNLHAFRWANSLHVWKFRPTFLVDRVVSPPSSLVPRPLPAILICSCLTSRRNQLTSGAEGVQWMLAVGVHRWSATMPHVRHRPLGRAHAYSVQRDSQEDGQH